MTASVDEQAPAHKNVPGLYQTSSKTREYPQSQQAKTGD